MVVASGASPYLLHWRRLCIAYNKLKSFLLCLFQLTISTLYVAQVLAGNKFFKYVEGSQSNSNPDLLLFFSADFDFLYWKP